MRRSTWRLAGLALALQGFAAGSVEAMQFRRADLPGGQPVIVASGTITEDDSVRMRDALDRLGGRRPILVVVSPGGRLLEGERMARIIAEQRIPVAVPPGQVCASACFLLFAASPVRMAEQSSRIGVHSSSIDARENVASMAATTGMARTAQGYGVPPSVIGRMVTTGPSQIAWITADEMRQMRVRPFPSLPGVDLAALVRSPPKVETSAGEYRPPVREPAAVRAARAARVPPTVPPEQLRGESTAFSAGLQARTDYEVWRQGLDTAAAAGAAHWRDGAGDAQCDSDDAAFKAGCEEARARLDPALDPQRATADYQRGWGSFLFPAYRVPVLTALRDCVGRPNLASPGFTAAQDLNADGVPDYVLDYRRLGCAQFCTATEGCLAEIYMSGPDGHRRVFQRQVRAFQLETAERPVLTIAMGGQSCREIMAPACTSRLTWNGSQFR